MSLEISPKQEETEKNDILLTKSMEKASEIIRGLTSEKITEDLKNAPYSGKKLEILLTGEGLNLIDVGVINDTVVKIFESELANRLNNVGEWENELNKEGINSSSIEAFTTLLERAHREKEVCEKCFDRCKEDPNYPLEWYGEIKGKVESERIKYYEYLSQMSANFSRLYGSDIDIKKISDRTLVYPPYIFDIFAKEESAHNKVPYDYPEGYNVSRENIDEIAKKPPSIIKMNFYPSLQVDGDKLTLVASERNKSVIVHETIHNLAEERTQAFYISGKEIICLVKGFRRSYFDQSGDKIDFLKNPELVQAVPDSMMYLDEATVMLLEQVMISPDGFESALDRISSNSVGTIGKDYTDAKHLNEMVEIAKIIGIEKIAYAHLNSDVKILYNAIIEAKGEEYFKIFLEKISTGGREYYSF